MTNPTLIVAGITRSGLSVTMQMLHAGGYPCLGDPPAFEDYSMDAIPWDSLNGKAVKLVDAHHCLPPAGSYRVIRLHRDVNEQAKSINKWNAMLVGLPSIDHRRLTESCWRDYKTIDAWANQHDRLSLDFEEIITDPLSAAMRLADWVGGELDVSRMAAVVRPRKASCYPGLLELELI